MRKMHFLLAGLSILALTGWMTLPCAAANDQPIVLISHLEVAADSLTSEEVKQIFLGKKTRWEDGAKIVFVLYSASEPYRIFLKQYVGKTIFQYNNYWKKQVFTGKGRMPRAFNTSDEVLKYVAQTEGAISFVPTKDADATIVKILPVK